MGLLVVVGTGLAVLAASLVLAVRLRRTPRRAARAIILGFAICVLLISMGVVVSSLW